MSDAIPDEKVKACPECDAANPAFNSGHVYGARNPDADRYRCRRCGATFDEPKERKRRGTGARHGLARRLEDADPDDVGRELATDGGTRQGRNWPELSEDDIQEALGAVVEDKGPYFKASDVAEQLDIDPRPAGRLLGSRDDVDAWGFSRTTTWRYVGDLPDSDSDPEASSEAVPDGGSLRRCGNCETLNNVVVNDERCYSCGQSWEGEPA